ncbi:MAG TPA: HEPN domain-containing protein [Thermoanaerobaculia bacterium]|nr:HEPN domain-containing protein [Thermoanaerobaculia bacterium]
MDIAEQERFWRRSAREDWDVGRHLVEVGRVRHGLFFAHLALEKVLKAHVCVRTRAIPPRYHNLVRLLELAEIDATDSQLDVLAEMNAFNIEGRYPDALSSPPSQSEAKEYLRRAEEAFEWLMTQS